MPLTIQRAITGTDLNKIFTLFNTKVPAVTGTTIINEFNADFGSTMPMTLAVWHPKLTDPNSRIVMGFQPANTLRGAAWWERETLINGTFWTVRLVGIDKSLTDAQRLSGFRDCVLELAGIVVPTTKCAGDVKIGGKLDTYMQPRLATRIVHGNGFVRYETTAAEMLARL